MDVIEVLLGFGNQPSPTLRVATLQAIGYICETIVCGSISYDDADANIVFRNLKFWRYGPTRF